MDKPTVVFPALLEQLRVKNILAGILSSGRIANGYIFSGPQACGKTTAARDFIKALNCTDSTEPTVACLSCLNCRKIADGNSPDFFELDTNGETIKIDQVRQLGKHVQYGPAESKQLLVLIQNADRLTTEAANSFLKILEEPPPGVFFILETSRPAQLLNTIISRCQLIGFDPLSELAIKKIVGQNHPEVDLNKIAKIMVSRNYADVALAIEQQQDYNDFVDFLATLSQRSFVEISDFSEKFTKQKDLFISYMKIWLNRMVKDKKVVAGKLILDYLNKLQKNVNLKLTLEVFLLKLREVI